MKSILFLLGMLAFMVVVISVAPEAHAGDEHTGHVSVFRFLFYIVTILLAAKVGGELFETWNQPAVLGRVGPRDGAGESLFGGCYRPRSLQE